MTAVENLLQKLIRLGGVIGVAAIAALMLLTVLTVVLRVVGVAFPGSYAMSEILLIPAISFSLAYATWDDVHTRVDFVTKGLPKRARSALDVVITLLGLGFWAVITYAVTRDAIKHGAQHEVAPIINIPVAPFRWLMVTALVLLCATMLLRAAQAALGKDSRPSGHDEPGYHAPESEKTTPADGQERLK